MNKIDKDELEVAVRTAYWKMSAITIAIRLTEEQEIWPTDEDDNLIVGEDLLEIVEATGGKVIDYNPSKRSVDATGCIFLVRTEKAIDKIHKEAVDEYENAVRSQALAEAAEFFVDTDSVVSLMLGEMSYNALVGEDLYTSEDDEEYEESPRECGTIMLQFG